MLEKVFIDKKTLKRVDDSDCLYLQVCGAPATVSLDMSLQVAMDLFKKSGKKTLVFTFGEVTAYLLDNMTYDEVFHLVEDLVGADFKYKSEISNLYLDHCRAPKVDD